MKAEDYLDFEAEGGKTIRFHGTRLSIYSLARLYRDGWSAEQIVESYPGLLTDEAVYAGLAYYLSNRAEIDRKLESDESNVRRSVDESRLRNGGHSPGMREALARRAADMAEFFSRMPEISTDDYLVFVSEPVEEIAYLGSGMPLDEVLKLYRQGWTTEQLAGEFENRVTMEELHFSLAFYERYKSVLDRYLARRDVLLSCDSGASPESVDGSELIAAGR